MSSNDSIAKVNKEGTVEALNPGKAEITAKSSQGYSKCTINVLSSDLNNRLYDSNGISIKKVNADGTKVNGFVSQAKGQNFTVMVDGIDESNVKSCKWSVGNSDVVSKLSAVSGSKLKATLKAVNEAQS
ncbi:MAG: Ig-like domain-containing protein [Eubacterium ventriosum]